MTSQIKNTKRFVQQCNLIPSPTNSKPVLTSQPIMLRKKKKKKWCVEKKRLVKKSVWREACSCAIGRQRTLRESEEGLIHTYDEMNKVFNIFSNPGNLVQRTLDLI